MESGRLEAFSDGVFAVAITLLALELAVPKPGLHHPSLTDQLSAHWPSFAAYLVSFLTIGIIWVNHHTLFRNIAQVDRPLLFLNLLLLFFVVSIPFVTTMFADYLKDGGPDARVAAAIYEGVFVGMGVSFGILFWWTITHEHLKAPLPPGAVMSSVIRFGIGNIAYVAAVGIAFVSPASALLISGLVAVYYVFEQTPGRKGRPGAGSGAGQEADSGQQLGGGRGPGTGQDF
ncbi:MAG: TMEM175 family protein [Streptosporangiaceae bacterium]